MKLEISALEPRNKMKDETKISDFGTKGVRQKNLLNS